MEIRHWLTRRNEALVTVRKLDHEIFRSVAGADNPVLDEVLPRLTRSANYSKLWLGCAGAMALTGKRSLRRAAGRGLASLAVTSLLVNQLAKRSWSRARPGHASVPLARRIQRYPKSSSFPSGHSASAAAFAVGAGMEDRAAGAVLGVLAGMVGFSRVYTGAHYPGDVVVGWGMGAAIALASGKLAPPPVSKHVPRIELTYVDGPVSKDGEGLVLVVNPASGGGTGERILEQVEKVMPKAEIVVLTPDDDIAQVLESAAGRAEILGVGGGDGTVATAAGIAIDTDTPLAVFPGGTFNYFAKQMGCVTPRKTMDAVRAGTLEKVDVVTLNDDTVLLNAASIGAYPQFVEIREKYEGKIGKPLAAAVAAWRMSKSRRAVEIRYEGTTLKTSLFFLGNSKYLPTGFAPVDRIGINDGLLDVRILETGKRLARLRVVGALLLGRLSRSPLYHEFETPAFRFEVLGGPTEVAHDGEVGEALSEIEFVSRNRVLSVYRPRWSGDGYGGISHRHSASHT